MYYLCLPVVPCGIPLLVGLGIGTCEDFPTQGSPMHLVAQGRLRE